MILEDPVVNQTIGGKIADALNEDFTYELEIFNRECCDEEIERICKCTQACGAKMIVGIGGGKTLDTAKAVGATLNLPIIVIPTLASTDAPCNSLVVIYTARGQFKRYMMIPITRRLFSSTRRWWPMRRCVSCSRVSVMPQQLV